MPENDKYAIESNPVKIIVIPRPLRPSGILEYRSLNRMAAIHTMAK